MKKSNKAANDRDQLKLAFEKSGEELHKAYENFSAAAQALAEASQGNPETKTMIDEQVKSSRKAINRMVRILADQTGLDFHTVWVLTYHQHHKRTGYHAVAASDGKAKTHLDQAQADGQLPELVETVKGMLTDPTLLPDMRVP